MAGVSRVPALLAAAAALPLLLSLLSVPVGGQVLSATITAPVPGGVVEGLVLLNGTAHDPAGRLKTVEVAVEDGPTLAVNIPGNLENATWETEWDSTTVPDGERTVSATALNKDGDVSAPHNVTFIVDNDKEPRLTDFQIRVDLSGNGTDAAWNDTTDMPTTRILFDLAFSEPMNETAIRAGTSFAGGASTWALTPNGTTSYRMNVSYLEANASYNFTVGAPGADLAGNPVAAYHLEFQTVAEPTDGTPLPPEEPTDPEEPGGDPDEPGDPEGPGTNEGGLNLPFAIESRFLWIGGLVAALAVALGVVWRKGLRAGAELEERYEPPFYEDDE